MEKAIQSINIKYANLLQRLIAKRNYDLSLHFFLMSEKNNGKQISPEDKILVEEVLKIDEEYELKKNALLLKRNEEIAALDKS